MKYVLHLLIFCSSQFCFGEWAEPYDYEGDFIKTMDIHLDALIKIIQKNESTLSEKDKSSLTFHVHHAKNIFYYFKIKYLEPVKTQDDQ